MTIDITPEAVEHLCAIHEEYEQHGTVDTLRALSAALQDYQRGQAYRYLGKNGLPILARDLEDQRDAAIAALQDAQAETTAVIEWAAELASNIAPLLSVPVQQAIRAITPSDSKAALDRMITEAEKRGLRKAADIVAGFTIPITMAEVSFDIVGTILAAIQKGTDHE